MTGVDVWHKPFRVNERLFEQSLSADEKEKASKFFKEEDSQRYKSAHIFLRAVLTHYFPSVKKEAWSFETNAYGKPFIAKVHEISFHFNLSHSASHIYIVCTHEKECGIDVEEIKEIELSPELLNLVMSKEEQEDFALSHEKEELFFRYWTAKEAYVKAIGKGISLALSNVEFKELEIKPRAFEIEGDFFYSKLIEENYYLCLVILQSDKDNNMKFYKEENL